ncbi:MAG: hypothetical protein ACFFCZ_31065 [Promethearchaeota archaeon]
MKNISIAILLAFSLSGFAQKIDLLELQNNLESVNVSFSEANFKGKKSIKVIPSAVQTEARFVKLNTIEFENGTIEIVMAGKRLEGAGANARGFVGMAFRVNKDNSEFECFYIRPTNGRAEDQLRRNHSVQYICFPDYPWYKLREETPGKYETYTDLQEGVWTKLKIEVEGNKAKLYVNDVEQPTLLVNDLKLGTDISGNLGLWVGPGTEAYFANLNVTKK